MAGEDVGRHGDVLAETVAALWPGSGGGEVVRRSRPGGRDYWVAPSWSSPRWLLPVDAPAATSALLGAASGGRRAAVVGALTRAQRTGLPARLPVRRLRVPGTAGPGLLEQLEAQLGPGTRIAVRLGSWAQARTAVLRAFAPDGRTLAFGKVGIDAHGVASVAAESRALATVHGHGLRLLRAPTVVATGEHDNLAHLLLDPLLSSGPATPGAPPWEAMHELATAGGAHRGPLPGSRWARGLATEVGQVVDDGTRHLLRDALSRVLRSAGDRTWSLGPAHGDWTPWNMVAPDEPGGAVLLWDWEHYRDEVPEGLDAVHHLAQALRVQQGTTPGAELEWERRAHALLSERMGLDAADRAVLLAAYLVDVNVRFVLDRQDSVERHRRRQGWALDLVERHARALPLDHMGDAQVPHQRDG